MAYSRPDGIEAVALEDGGFELLVTIRGRIYSRVVGRYGLVTQAEAATIVRPMVSRVAVYKWVQSGKLKAEMVEGISMIRLSKLREFAAEHGYLLAGEE